LNFLRKDYPLSKESDVRDIQTHIDEQYDNLYYILTYFSNSHLALNAINMK